MSEDITFNVMSEKAIFKTATRLEDWGKWKRYVWSKWEYAKCPYCGITNNVPTNYCPQCGANMGKEDAVHVVRCRDCKWQPETIYGIRGEKCNQLWCVCFNTWVPMDHYCSKGERKDTQ